MTLRKLVVCAALFSGVTFASWEDVQRLQKNSTVRVTESGGKNHSGRITGATATSLVILKSGSEVSIARDSIARVAVKSSGRRLRNGLIGAGAGLAVGLVTDETLGVRLRNEGSGDAGTRAAMIALPAALFGGIGAAFPGYRTIYKAPR